MRTTGKTRRAEAGSALIWALLFVVLTTGMVYTHATFLSAARKERAARTNRDVIADTFARSGVTETIGWFRRQGQHPVTAFAPVLDPDGNPPRFDTIDPTLGLVREFEIDGNLWGRYEIRKDEAIDISGQRGSLAPGTIWEFAVRSYVYRIVDPDAPFDQAPNRMVAKTRLQTEIRRLQLNLPAPSAVCVDAPGNLEVGKNAAVDGNGSGAITYTDPASMDVMPLITEPKVDGTAMVTGVPSQLPLSTYDAASGTLFGMRLDELRSYADMVLIPGKTPFPRDENGNIYAENAVVYMNGDIFTFSSGDGARYINCLVIYDGDLTKLGSSQTVVEGVVYITGDARLESSYDIRGSLIVRGDADLGTGSERVVITYDAQVVEKLRQMLARYREQRGRTPAQ